MSDPHSSTPPPPPPPPPPRSSNPFFPHEPDPSTQPELAHDREWQRLDPRMLLVHPARELLRFLPVLVVVFFAGSANNGPPWHYLGVLFPIAFGVLRYLTTGFRVAEGRVELRRGLLNRHVLSTRQDRVRTVDLTSSPIHRLLGLTTVRIGTGSAGIDDTDLDLDALPVERARELRRELLHVAAEQGGGTPDSHAPAPETTPPLVLFTPAWLRFAPFTGAGLIVAAAVFGGISQLLNLTDSWEKLDVEAIPVPPGFVVVTIVVLLLILVIPISVVGYALANWGFSLTRADGSWHVARGLLTTRETSLDEERVAGISLGEGLALRLARGRALDAIVTGVDRTAPGSSSLVPPAPGAVVLRVAAQVLDSSAAATGPLRAHGPAAVRRRWTRALVPTAVLPLAAVVVLATGGPWWPLVPTLLALALMTVVAADRAAGLGHTLVEGYVVARSGSLARRRQALAVGDVIGWTFRATYPQRRLGLTSLVATTAGGSGSVAVLDLPLDAAVALADEALPGLVEQFLA